MLAILMYLLARYLILKYFSQNCNFLKICSTTQDLKKQDKHFLPTKESSKPLGRQTDQF